MDHLILKILASTAYAADVAPAFSPAGNATTINTGSNLDDIKDGIYGKALEILLLIAGAAAVLYIVWAGIQYITSNGNADKAKVAKQGIINAVIGIVIIYIAYYIIRLSGIIGNTITPLIK